MMLRNAALPVTILSGYLGAGKTTLVNQMLRKADGKRLAVMVNEFGDLPIDADLIEAEGDDLIALAGGCVCCSYGDDLMAALAQMSNMDPPPDHIILEASGVALPAAIASSLSLVAGIEMAGIVVLADVGEIQERLANEYIGDTVIQQLEAADLVLLTKTDIALPSEREIAHWRIAAHSNGATMLEASHGHVPLDVVLSPEIVKTPEQGQPHGNASGLMSSVDVPEGVVDPEEYAGSLAICDSVIRAKGHVKTANGMMTVQIVGKQAEISVAPKSAQVGVVIIRVRDSAAPDVEDI